MKNFKYLGIVFVFSFIFLVSLLLSLVGLNSAKAISSDGVERSVVLASTKALYLARIDDKQAAVQAQIDRISGLSYINATAKTQLTNNFNSYNTNYLVSLEKQINASSTEDQVIDLINSDWQLPYMVLVKSMFSYANANVVAGNIQTAYQLINDTKTFVDSYTTNIKYNLALSENNKNFALRWNFIKGAYAQEEPVSGWTCRKYDKTDSEICGAQVNLRKSPCFWDIETSRCLGDKDTGVDFAKRDADGKGCEIICLEVGLNGCYQNSKCAANGLLEEYTEPAELPPVNGVCGTADQHVYTYTDTSWGKYIGCKVGTSSKPEFPKAGTTANWTCAGIDGGKNVSCSASRSACGNGILDSGEKCDDANSINAEAGDLCYNNCTKRYLDEGDTTILDKALAKLKDHKSSPEVSLDSSISDMDTLLVNIYNVYSQGVTENEKLVLMTGYKQSLEALYTSTQNVSSDIVTQVVNILAL